MINIKHRNTTHGMSDHRLHVIWSKMKARCKDPGRKDAKYYFDKGISVCDQWKESFLSFAKWALSNGYAPSLVLDRKNGNKNYSPDNCQWVTVAQNNRNKSTTKLSIKKVQELRIKYLKGGVTQVKLAKEYGISTSHLCSVLKNRYWNEDTI